MKESPDQKPTLEDLLAQCDETAPMPQELIEWEQVPSLEEEDPEYMALVDETVARARERLANPLQGIKVTLDDL